MSNLDSQSSAAGGIVIQVLGEMSNNNGPWRKFAQTFFLAEQPNGYYVLNDIFRYLKDDVESNDIPAEAVAAQEATKAPKVAEKTPAAQPEKQAAPAPAQEEPKAANPAPAAAQAPAEQKTASAAAPAAAAPAPSGPKTWANLAATGAGKWGNAASDARGVSEAGKPAPAAAQAVAPATAAPGTAGAQGTQRRGANAQGATPQVFVKNVVAPHVTAESLRVALEAFGPVKDVQVNAGKEFAFAEFNSADAARRAIGANGVRIGEWTVVVEKRRPTERSGGGRGRGGGSRGSAGRGRGGAQHA